MSRPHQVIKEKGSNVPGYIVTFSDMVTLLLTFFVMLLSLSQVQDEELFHKGRESFLLSMKHLGLGMLYGRKQRPDFGNTKIRYFIRRPDKLFKGRTIDVNEEEARRTFKEINLSMKTIPSQIVAKTTNFSVTNIRFPRGDATLNKPAKNFLTEFCLGLQQDPGSKAVKLYVLGLAGKEATEKKQWMLSAKRAKVVADFLQESLSSESQWPVYSWGAGPGGDWVAHDSPISRQSQILIGVLRADD